jgi:hypothetical protein
MNSSDKSPTADVYAADLSSPATGDATEGAIHCFTIEADAEPGTFARIANVLNIANTAPRRVSLEPKNAGTLSICIEIRVGFSMAQSIQRKLAQLTDVLHVHAGIVPSDVES